MEIIEVRGDRFKVAVLESAVPVLVDFWAPWCGYCRRLSPVIDVVAKQLGEKVKVNIDDAPELKEEYGVKMIHSLILFRDGRPGPVSEAPKSKADVDAWLASQGI
ncbi:thioredoxin family protein [Eubacterium aggregans]|uniref:thioredoxin family protein n=1 Tax=Eubacterium aggregans TaxID=81409 RepID=UPI003F2EBE71